MTEKKWCNNCAHWVCDWHWIGDEEYEIHICELMEDDEETPNYDWHIPVCDAWEDCEL